MKIGIIVYSHTGNTYSVAQRLMEELKVVGHSVTIERVTAVGDEQTEVGKIKLKKIPDMGAYDALIFGSPVRGASLSQVMTAYLSQITSLQGKKVACFVTQFFPYKWMGGNRAIEQMKKISESKGAEVLGTGIVNWLSISRNKKIVDIVKKLCRVF
jgi:flavodoxin